MSEIAFCQHCQRPVCGIKYGDRMILYLDRFKSLPEDLREVKEPMRFSAHGLSDALGIPIAAVYRTKDGLIEMGYLDITRNWLLTSNGKRVYLYSLTDRGRRYAAELRTFQQRVAEALP
ncbi:MAG: hypothetical protein A4E31_00850 [Methanomassiliicoccales archaeon PtaU1.Bin030]|nr:MAG: hypothetical protein A4E31_00850 [Methanomassiliicoccales archaeon PtaU1.Bin030]